LYPHDEFVLKVTQWEELLSVRHSNFLMGAPGAGKSEVFRALAKAQTFKGLKTRFVDINPKAVTTKELYGYITLATREWRDGVLSKTMRDLGNMPDELPKWLVLDGDLDANWIEAMNSVMDDNKMLTLASNERIPLKAYMKMIFEIRDLRFASPATVSRAGILYIATEDGYQWRCIVKSFIEHLKDKDDDEKDEHPAVKEKLQELFDEYMPNTLLEIAKFYAHVVFTEAITMVQSTINMLKCLLPCLDFDTLKGKKKQAAADDDDEEGGAKEEEHEDVPWDKQLETAFVYCAVWACGSGFGMADDGTDVRKAFSDWWRSEYKNVKFPSRDTVFDYWLDTRDCKFEQWTKSPYFYAIDYRSDTPMSTTDRAIADSTATSSSLMGMPPSGASTPQCGPSPGCGAGTMALTRARCARGLGGLFQ
jgi:dynein heavy chain